MLVDATKYPGPALWQGIMLILLCVITPVLFYVSEEYPEYAKIAFIIFSITVFSVGAGLLFII